MTRGALALGLLTLGACSWFGGDKPAPAVDNRPEAVACRREVRDSPEMRELMEQSAPENPFNQARIGTARRQLETRLMRDCLRRKGAALPGGVEPLRPR